MTILTMMTIRPKFLATENRWHEIWHLDRR
jgi:hypothetical protein